MEEKDRIDQSELAESVSNNIPYTFLDFFLVKPLEPVKVKKEITKPVSDKEAKADENGIEAVDYDKTEKEIIEVDSDYRKGVVIKVPTSYTAMIENEDHPYTGYKISLGDVLVFREAGCRNFDLLKDSKLVKYFDIIAVEK